MNLSPFSLTDFQLWVWGKWKNKYPKDLTLSALILHERISPSCWSCFQAVWRRTPLIWSSSLPPQWSWSPAGFPPPTSPPPPTCAPDSLCARWPSPRPQTAPCKPPRCQTHVSRSGLRRSSRPDLYPSPSHPGPGRPDGSGQSVASSVGAPSGSSMSPSCSPCTGGKRRAGRRKKNPKLDLCLIHWGKAFFQPASEHEVDLDHILWLMSWRGWSSWLT